MATLGSTLFPLSTKTEADPVAIAALDTAKTELNTAIALKADNADLTAAVTQIEAAFNDIDLTKADKTDLTAANKAISDLTAALASNTATDAELDAAMNAANDAIAKLQAVKPVVEVTSVLARTTPTLYWPANFTAANPVGSYLVRGGQVDTVAVTRGNQFWDNTWEEVFSFARADFGKKLILRIALPAEDTNRSYRVHGQNALGGVLCSLTLSHDGAAWVCQGATVIVNRGYAVASFPITLSASSICSFWSSVDSGRCQKIAFYEPGKEVLFETVVSGSEIATKTELANLDLRLAGLLNLEAGPGVKVAAGEGTIFSGALWVNRSGVEKILPATAALIVEKWFTDNLFERSVADLSGRVTATESSIVTLDASISTAIAEWKDTRSYKIGSKVIRSDAFFRALKDNLNIDPITDTASNWVSFVPGSSNDIFANRSPVATDVQPVGVRWHDSSFGVNTLDFVSLGGGAWQFINAIALTKIRLHIYGESTTYRSKITTIAIYKEDGAIIPNNWLVWGASTVLSVPTAGTAYSGQTIGCARNISGWVDIEPSINFDPTISLGKITAGSTSEYARVSMVEFHFSNGGIKTYSPGVLPIVLELNPAQPARYGSSIEGAKGEVLTAIKLADPNSPDPGRINGIAFGQAWMALYQKQTKQIGFGDTLPVDSSVYRLFLLEGHATLPDGLWRWDGVWVEG
jgi:hypothetical protein